MEKRRLGRGLDALLGNGDPSNSGVGTTAPPGKEQPRVPIERIDHNPYQPRKTFDDDELTALSESVKTHGILQPLVVRPMGDRYQLIAGERRLRAARAAGFGDVPVQVIDLNDQQVLEAALVENIQRTDLNPIEKALGFHDYLERFKMTQEELARRLSIDRSTLANLVRLLELPPEVQEAVRVGQISPGHARPILGVPDAQRQVALCREIIARGLTVRATEALAKEDKPDLPEPSESKTERPAVTKTAHVQSIEDELRHCLATRVRIRLKAKDKGQIVLSFDSNDEFDRLLELLRGHAPKT